MAHGPQILWRGNDNTLVLENVRSQVTGAILNNAVGSVSLYGRDNVAIPGGGPFAFAYTIGSQGVYTAIIPASATATLDETVAFIQCIITLTGPTGHMFTGILNARLKENTL